MRTKLTDLTIQRLPHPAEGQVKYWDTVVPGFGIRATAHSKSFFVAYGTKRQSKTLGKYPAMSLKTARDEAKRFQTTQQPTNTTKTLTEARKAFLEECEGRLSHATHRQYVSYLSKIDKTLITDVERADIDTSHPHTVASWKAFFNWCIKQGYIDRNPFQFLKAQNGRRERTLSDEEIRQLWAYDFPPFSNIIKLLFLTGLRRTEVTNLVLDGDTFKLAPEHTKNNKGHVIPATKWAKSFYLKTSFNGWSKAKARMDQHTGVTDYVLHDIRRTFATMHARLGTPIHVVEALLNHQSGTISGIKAVYIRHNFMAEADKALARYEEHLQTIVA